MKNIPLLKSTTAIVFLFFFHIGLTAQNNAGKITFLNESHDFGKLEELGGEAKYDFKFVNTGSDSIKLLSVQASCGCTTPFWEKGVLMPGDTGKIEVAYNPFNRPGSFSKTVTVSSSGEPHTKILKIAGYVNPKPRTPKEDYPTEIGGIRLNSKFLNFGNITTEKAVTKSFEIYNQSDDSIRFLDRIIAENFIQLQFNPEILSPKEKGELLITYFPNVRNDLGFMNDHLTVFTDEVYNSQKSLNIIATILEYFPPMTAEELARAPHMEFETVEYDFGHINEGEVLSHSFEFTNTGKMDLNIRKTKSTCGCTVSKLEKMDYKGGESGGIAITFDSTGRNGTQIKRVTLFTNDPTAPARDLIVKAYVRGK